MMMNSPSSSLGPSIWAVSDGRAGNAAQVRAVIAALSEPQRWLQIGHIDGHGHRADPITLTPRVPWTWLPGADWPVPQLALPKSQRQYLSGPWPSLWIAAGRRSAPYTAAVRGWSGHKTFTVQILDPKSDPDKFDLVIVPEHDLLDGPNVIRTTGSPTHFSGDAIEETGQAFADLADENGKSAVVILGGDSKAHTFDRNTANELAGQLETLAGRGWRLRITCSRRTPLQIATLMRQLADRIGAHFWANDQDGPNPYLAWLLYSDVAIVTEDSANMLSDAAWHGLPVHILKLKGDAPKFDRLHQSLVDRGCARWFEGDLEIWDYQPLREAERVADKIIEKLLERHPQPELGVIDETKTARPSWA
ncbi:MAG: mitochondrial fission ELM1 family protein [Pseudomonadota bacterium]